LIGQGGLIADNDNLPVYIAYPPSEIKEAA
jgi:hypothetical protein